MRNQYWPLILVFLFASCSAPAKNQGGSLAFVGPGAGTPQIYIGEGATFEVTVENSSVARSLGKLQFFVNGNAADAQLLDMKAGTSTTFRFYDRPADPGVHAYEVTLFQGKKQVDSLTFSVVAIPALTADLGWVTASVAPLQALSDTTIHVEAVAKNFGAVRAFATVEVHVLSLAATDVTVGRFNLPVMEAGATAPVSVDLSVFGNISGVARLVLQASSPDTDATNDSITVGPLEIVAPDWSIDLEGPINVAATSPIAVTTVVMNRTEFALPPHSFRVWHAPKDTQNLEADALIGLLGSVPIPALQPGTGVIVTSYWPAPAELGMARGETYMIIARLLDEVDRVTDTTDDNLATTTLYVYDRLPDLAAVSITASTHQGAGGMQLNIAGRFANDGSDPTIMPYEIWLTGPLNTRLLKTQLPGSMFARTAQNWVTTVTLPALPDGGYALRVTLDVERNILEFREDNNAAVDPLPFVVAPDIVASIVSATPVAIAPDATVSVGVQWSNIGNPSVATTASLWMVSGTTEKSHEFVTSVTVPGLATQEIQSITYAVQPLRGKGTYTWVVSAATAQAETVWANNRFQTSTTQSVSSSLAVVSRIDGDTQILASAAVADVDGNGDTEIFMGSKIGFLYALRASDSTALWNYDFGGNRLVHPPALADMNGDLVLDVIVTVGGRADGVFAAGTLAALDGTDGTLIWSMDEPAYEFFAPPAVGDLNGDGIPDIIVEAGSLTDGGYFALVTDGNLPELWRVASTPAGLVGGAVIVPDANGDLLDDVFVATLSGGMGVFISSTGLPVWNHQYGVSFASSPAVGDITGSTAPEIVLAGVSTDALSTAVVVLAFDSVSGVEQWRFEHPGMSAGAPVIVDIDGDGRGEIIIPISRVDDDNGAVGHTKIIVLASDGTPRDVVEIFGSVAGAPAIRDVYSTGFWTLGVATSGPAAQVEIATPYSSANTAPWSKFRGNLRNTGRLGD